MSKADLKEKLEMLAVAAGLLASGDAGATDELDERAQRKTAKAEKRATKAAVLLLTRWQAESAYALSVRALSGGAR
jgi:asparagine synthetase A